MEDSGAVGDLSCGSSPQEVLEEKIFSMWPRDYSPDILARMWLTFCPKSLPKSKVKSFRLITLTKEISKQLNTVIRNKVRKSTICTI